MNDSAKTRDVDSPPASEGSTTSWPATEVELSEDAPTPRATSKEDPGTDEGVNEPSETAKLPTEQPAKDEGADESSTGTTDSLATSPSWSRSRLPVSDDEDAPSKVEDSLPKGKEEKGEEVSQNEESGSLGLSMDKEAEGPTKERQKTCDGAAANELDKEDQPKRPAFVLTRPTVSGENELVSITQPSTPSGSVAGDNKDEDKPDPRNIRITTFLPETTTFFTSPTTTNAIPNSAVSPLTQTFFSTDFSVRSPPRPGGAFITELPSDAEVTVSQAVKITVGEPKPSRPRSRDPSRSRNASPARRPPSQNRKRIPSSSPVRPPRSHSSSHTRVYRPPSDSDDDTSDARPTHLPFVRGRTVVSAPPLRTAPPGSFKIHRQVPQYSHPPRESPYQYEEPRRPASRPEEPRRRSPRQEERSAPSLSNLLDDLKKALKNDPATYYAVKGLLVEHDERKRESRKEEESYRAPEERRSSARRHDDRRTRYDERPADVFEPRIPVSFAFMTGASGSETEVDKGRSFHQDKLRKPARTAAPPLRPSQPTSHDERYRESSRLPTTSHGVKYSDGDRRPHRPVPVRIHHPLSHAIPSPEPPYPSSRDPSPQRFLPRSQTLTMAQAARLAEGLGDRRQADGLRKTGLKSGDKVSLLDEHDGGEKSRKKEEKISSGVGKSSKKEKRDGERRDEKPKSARRHSFDSVVDYKPSPQSTGAKQHGEPPSSSSRKAEKTSRPSARKDDPYRSPVDKPADFRYSTGRPRATIDRYVASEASSKKGGKGKERAISFDFDDLM